MTMIVVLFTLLLITMVLMVQVFLSLKGMSKSESLTPLESGFESLNSSMSVSAPFFFLSILFVLFDLELILFFPGIVCSYINVTYILLWIIINFVVVFTLMMEWAMCGLKWQI